MTGRLRGAAAAKSCLSHRLHWDGFPPLRQQTATVRKQRLAVLKRRWCRAPPCPSALKKSPWLIPLTRIAEVYAWRRLWLSYTTNEASAVFRGKM
jgi:hypothetical protein